MRRIESIFAMIVLVACQKPAESPPPAPAQTQTAPAPSAPVDASTAEVNKVIPLADTRFLEHAAVGTPDPQGVVQTESTSFKRGQKIFASVRAREVPVGLVGRAVWLDARGKELAAEQKPIPTDTRTVTFEAKNAAKWKPGTYTVQLWLGGDKVHETEITISR